MNFDNLIALKARLLCEGVNPNSTEALFRAQNPSNVRRGGLSSGGKIFLGPNKLPVNIPFYRKLEVPLKIIADPSKERGVFIMEDDNILTTGEVLPAPSWYGQKIEDFDITQIFTAHNNQLATAVYEGCDLFKIGKPCQFCVINNSCQDSRLVMKNVDLILSALGKIPVDNYAGLTLNGGMTLSPGRGMEIFEPVIRVIHERYPYLPIALEITPPDDLNWIDRLTEAGLSSLMMNLEMWDKQLRSKLIPGKNQYCPRESYLKAFERGIKCLGKGKVSTCFVVGTESMKSLKEGITEVIKSGVIPSLLAGRYFEDIPNYPFIPSIGHKDFLEIMRFAKDHLRESHLVTTDRAGCVACGMCDLIKDIV